MKLFKREPVAFFGGLQGVWLATLIAAGAFDWWYWTDDQKIAVNGIWLAVTGFVTFLVRGKVTPVDPGV